MKVTLLGCGPSGGVPLVGCQCSVCQSEQPYNKRLRASIFIETEQARLLIDSSPDLRQQMLANGLTQADALLYTHGHADHTHGVDDLRAINYHRNAPLPIYGTAEFIEEFQMRFSYAFGTKPPWAGWTRPNLLPNVIEEYGEISINGLCVSHFLQCHGKGKSLGYRIGNFAYSTDVDNFPEQSLQLLESLDVWVVDCLRTQPAPTHAHLERSLAWIAQLKPKRAILTHMSHDLDYDSLRSMLPPHIEPAYDGMVIEL